MRHNSAFSTLFFDCKVHARGKDSISHGPHRRKPVARAGHKIGAGLVRKHLMSVDRRSLLAGGLAGGLGAALAAGMPLNIAGRRR